MNFKVENVVMAQKGNKNAFAAVYEAIYIDLYKMAFYILGNREDAEDIVSDTVLDAYREIKNLKNSNVFDKWILKILTNKCKAHFKQKYSDNVTYDVASLESAAYCTDMDTNSDVLMALSKLSGEERMLVSLSVFSGYKSHELGKVFGMSAGTVRSKLSRAMDKMEVFLEGENE